MAYKYHRLINEALRTPLALTADMYATVFEILRFRANGGRLSAAELAARIGVDEDAPAPTARRDGKVAIIPIWGVIAHRNFEASSGMTSTDFIGAALRRALSDDEVKSILLDVSSPGGFVTGVPELADLIFSSRQVKPITALTNGENGSAAYYLSSQASEVVSIPSGETGSIGVYGIHEDWSAWLEKEGIKITAFQVGARKLEGAPWLSLDDEAKAFYQARVEESGRQFHAAVSRARGVSVADVKKSFGDGRMFDAKTALKVGMIDRIATFEQTLDRMINAGRRRATGTRATIVADDTPAMTIETADDEASTATQPTAVSDAPQQPDADLEAAIARDRDLLELAKA